MTAFIFDMDGVIVDSTATHTGAWQAYLRTYGRVVEDLPAKMLGRHNDDLVRDLFAPEVLTEDAVVQHGARKEALYRDLIGPVLEDKLVAGVRDFLERRRAHPMAVATNAERANVDFVLDAASMRQYFSAVIDGGQVSRPKPHPDIYLRAAQLLGFAPENCVIFEDSLTGIQAARAAGATVVGVSTTLNSFPDVDFTIRDFADPALEPWLQERTASR